jgi:hypothetical protein
MEVTSDSHQYTTWSPEPKSHVIPRTDIFVFHSNNIACCPKKRDYTYIRIWSQQLPSHVGLSNVIACGPKNWQPYMVHTNGIAFGFQNYFRMLSQELPLHVGPQNCHGMCSHNCHTYVVPTSAILCGPSMSIDLCCK